MISLTISSGQQLISGDITHASNSKYVISGIMFATVAQVVEQLASDLNAGG